jgi:cell division protein ZapA (FtsZ GTPase activity inhibitor)
VSVTPIERAATPINAQSPAASRKRSMNLELHGQRLTVLSDTDEERVRDVVDFVNRKLEEAKESARRAPPDQIALLALLNVAEELFRERQSTAALRRRVRERSVKLLGAIDEVAQAFDAHEANLRSGESTEGTDGETLGASIEAAKRSLLGDGG